MHLPQTRSEKNGIVIQIKNNYYILL